ncbi:MAG: hypothetical protein JXA99_06945 [Candidatus Lokiarchaeota archaeon]|nr:hypothetical protein [Candidatus Lokiarchaeota archaeon]
MASNVLAEKTHIEGFFQPDLNFEMILDFEALINHHTCFNNLIPYLYYHYNESPLNNIIKITDFLLANIKNEIGKEYRLEFRNNFALIKNDEGACFLYRNHLNEKNYLDFIKKIRFLILSYDKFDIKEKGDLCKLERFFMKRYLNKINSE